MSAREQVSEAETVDMWTQDLLLPLLTRVPTDIGITNDRQQRPRGVGGDLEPKAAVVGLPFPRQSGGRGGVMHIEGEGARKGAELEHEEVGVEKKKVGEGRSQVRWDQDPDANTIFRGGPTRYEAPPQDLVISIISEPVLSDEAEAVVVPRACEAQDEVVEISGAGDPLDVEEEEGQGRCLRASSDARRKEEVRRPKRGIRVDASEEREGESERESLTRCPDRLSIRTFLICLRGLARWGWWVLREGIGGVGRKEKRREEG